MDQPEGWPKVKPIFRESHIVIGGRPIWRMLEWPLFFVYFYVIVVVVGLATFGVMAIVNLVVIAAGYMR